MFYSSNFWQIGTNSPAVMNPADILTSCAKEIMASINLHTRCTGFLDGGGVDVVLTERTDFTDM